MSLASIISLCSQRRQQQLNNVPFSRIEVISPYVDDNNLTNNLTKFQLDMRRKSEVLKYNQGNTKTNNLTKKQLYTQVINGNAPAVSNSYITQNTNKTISNKASKVLLCNNDDLPLTTPSSASGVPRDYINNINVLYSDPTVPLYNYINPVLTRSYGIINTSIESAIIRYSNFTNVNTNAAVSSSNIISTIEFTELTNKNVYTIDISNIPLALNIYGDISANSIHLSFDSISINSFTLNVFYNDQLVTPNSNYIYSFTPRQNYILDISSNVKLDGSNFSGTFFIGYLNIKNIVLYSSPGFLYSFQLITKLNYSSSYTDGTNILDPIVISTIANVTIDYLIQNAKYNCDLSFVIMTPVPTTYGVFTIQAL